MKLKVSKEGMFVEASNDLVILAGGTRSGNSDSKTTRLKFVIYDREVFNAEMKVSNQDEAAKKAESGTVELFIKDGTLFDVAGLVNIEMKRGKKRNGVGTKVIQSLINTQDGDLKIHDIQPGNAARFWKSLGIKLENGSGKEIKTVSKNGLVNDILNREIVNKKVASKLKDKDLSAGLAP